MSSACPAASFFRRVFSPSSCFKRLATSTLRLPYSRRQREGLLGDTEFLADLGRTVALGQSDIRLPELRDNLLGAVPLARHLLPLSGPV